MTVEFYGLKASPPCWSVLNLGHHMGIEFNFNEINVFAGEQFNEEFLKLNPQHIIPTIVDGDCTLWESQAILQYFGNKYDTEGTLYPADPEARAKVDQRLFFDMNLSNRVRQYHLAKYYNNPIGDPELLKALETQMGFLDLALQDQKYVAGDELTIADFSVMASVTFCELGAFPLENYENISRWMELCKETVPGILVDEEAKEILRAVIEAANKVEEEAPEEIDEGTVTTAEE